MKAMKLNRAALVAAAALCAAGTARAALITYTIGNGGLENVDVSYNNATFKNVLAGGISLTYVSGSTSLPANYTTVCTDINGSLGLGLNYGYDVAAFSGHSGISPTWGNPADGSQAAQAIQNAAYLFYKNSPANADQWAGLQLAVWEALYDTNGGQPFSLASGQFKAQNNNFALAAAGTYLADLTSHIPAPGTYTGYLLFPNPADAGSNPVQNGEPPQELLIRDTDFTPVPEASTLYGGVFAAIPFAVASALSRRKQSAP